MTNDILESISQGSCGEENSENNRIEEITNELRRRCKLYEEKCGVSQTNVCDAATEQRITEQYALEKGLWLPISGMLGSLGVYEDRGRTLF